MVEFESGIKEYIRRVQSAVKDWPEAKTLEGRREYHERKSEVFKVSFPENFSVKDRYISAPGRLIPIRIYRPKDQDHGPLILFFHGGGKLAGSIFTHDIYATGIAEKTGVQLISVNYRLAPENPYPAAVEDCYFALCWAVENADRLGIDASRIAIGGDSAGGTLTAATTLMARDKGGPSLRFQYIIYPSLDTDFNTDSYLTNTHDPFFSREKSIYNWKTYLEDKLDTKDPYAVPMRATDLSNLPPAYILTAEHDCLRDDGERYGERLARAGVPTVVRRAPGTIHGFLRARFVSKVAEEELENLCMAIREALDLP